MVDDFLSERRRVKGRRESGGWTAEMRIPLSQLRFRETDEQTWGVNFFRRIQRTRERAYWAPMERVFDIQRVSSAGEPRMRPVSGRK